MGLSETRVTPPPCLVTRNHVPIRMAVLRYLACTPHYILRPNNYPHIVCVCLEMGGIVT